MNTVTVIIPAYNPGAFLEVALRSVVKQTFSEWEVVVVDDGSTEDLSFVDHFHPRVRRIRQRNYGLSIARNTGILGSQSQYVAFLDADDVWHPTKLQLQVELLESNPLMSFCHTAHETVNERGEVTGCGFSQDLTSYSDLLRSGCVCVSTVMVRRECFNVSGLFDPLLSGVQDYDMWLKLSRHFEVGFISTTQAGYRVHSTNMSGNIKSMVDEIIFVLQRHRKLGPICKEKKVEKIITSNIKSTRAAWGAKSYDKCRLHISENNYKYAYEDFILSLKLSPSYTVGSLLKYAFDRAKKRKYP